jgi:ferritin-like metal-binding protein YciE
MSELKMNRQKLLDKLGERWLFEKKAVFLYDKIMKKLESLGFEGDYDQLKQFRAQEFQHQKALESYIQMYGGNIKRKTPSQRVVEIESQAFSNIIESFDDPSALLHVLLDAEMDDNASWEMLIQLARRAGQKDFIDTFQQCLDEEKTHLKTVKTLAVQLARKELAPEARV